MPPYHMTSGRRCLHCLLPAPSMQTHPCAPAPNGICCAVKQDDRPCQQWVVKRSVAVVRPLAPALEVRRRGRDLHQRADKPATPPSTYAHSCSSFPSLRAIRRHFMQRRASGTMNSYSMRTSQIIPRHKSATHPQFPEYSTYGSMHQQCERSIIGPRHTRPFCSSSGCMV